MSHTLTEINQLHKEAFVTLLGPVYEETPAVAEKVWSHRPFDSILDLHQKMAIIVNQMSEAEQLELIRVHPELGANIRMAAASVREQAGAGLSQMSEAERRRIRALNAAYQRKFGFPFVMAVKGYGKGEILAAFEERLGIGGEEERGRAIAEINKIARLRLEELIVE